MIYWMKRSIKTILGSKFLFWLAILYSVGITILFFIPTSGMPSVGFKGIDKVVHVFFFFFLVLLWQIALFKKDGDVIPRKIIFWILGIILVYGILVEVLQEQLTNTRTADPFDVLADFIGAVLGVFVFNRFKYLFKT